MKIVKLKCEHHPDLRWQAKSIAVNSDGSYNGRRSIFFLGGNKGKSRVTEDGEYIEECECPASDLTFANEDEKEKWKNCDWINDES